MMKRITKDEYYLGVALAVAKRSTCLKRHYGCIIVKNNEIIATGYNGSPRGGENCCDRGTCKRAGAQRYTGYESCDSVHAEQNAMLESCRKDMIGATIYLACEEAKVNEFTAFEREITWHEDDNPVPCPICMRMIKNAGIIRIVNRGGDVCL